MSKYAKPSEASLQRDVDGSLQGPSDQRGQQTKSTLSGQQGNTRSAQHGDKTSTGSSNIGGAKGSGPGSGVKDISQEGSGYGSTASGTSGSQSRSGSTGQSSKQRQ